MIPLFVAKARDFETGDRKLNMLAPEAYFCAGQIPRICQVEDESAVYGEPYGRIFYLNPIGMHAGARIERSRFCL